MLNYIAKIVGDCYFDGVDYYSTTGLVSQQDLISAYKLKQIDYLKTNCTNQIQAGFISNALGSNYTYQSALPQDQTNLLGAAVLNIDMPFTCIDSTGYKSKVFHTAAQIKQVFLTGANHIETSTTKYDTLKKQVETATTIAAIEGVIW